MNELRSWAGADGILPEIKGKLTRWKPNASRFRPIYTMRFVVTTCSIQLILHRVNAKITPISVKEVKETRLSLHGRSYKLLLPIASCKLPLSLRLVAKMLLSSLVKASREKKQPNWNLWFRK